MKIDAKNFYELSIGQTIWLAYSFQIPDGFQYVGDLLDRDGEIAYKVFSRTGKQLTIYSKNPESCHELKAGFLFTTYEECCECMRDLCLQTIDHFNKHQLKGNPIKVIQSQ